MHTHSSLPVRLGIAISTSIQGLFVAPEVPVCNGSHGI